MARALGEGRPVTREQIIRELYGAPVPAAPGRPDVVVTPTRLAPLFVEPPIGPDVTPDGPDAHLDPAPDSAVSFAEAAERLGVTVGTVRRYAAPSSGKLRRLGTGVTLASVESLAA